MGKKKFKQISAWIAIAVLVFMYLLLLVLSLLKIDGWYNYFMACLGATIIVPIILWVNIFLYDRIIGKNKGDDGTAPENDTDSEDRLD